MFPDLHFHIGTIVLSASTSTALYVFCFSLVSALWVALLRKDFTPSTILFTLLAIALVGLGGGRLWHALTERPELFLTPSFIFTRFEGLVFYGTFLFGFIALWIFSRALTSSVGLRKKLMDLGAFSAALSYGILRTACFLKGCCWGSMTSLPWSVQYLDPNSAMPALGIPVHPVQLYDSFLGFSLAAFLAWVTHKEKVPRGSLPVLFCLIFPVGRFITEFFRGDIYRGENLILGLSAGQVTSVVVFVAALMVSARLDFRGRRLHAGTV